MAVNEGGAFPPPHQVAPRERDRVARFLRDTFHPPEDAPFLRPPVLDWKYFAPRPDTAWPEGRSFAYLEDDRLTAHCAVWPLMLETAGESIPAMHLIDWAASKSHPGAGLILYRALSEKARCAVVIGGAAQARRILTRMGFAQVGEWNVYRRVVRPWRTFREEPAEPGQAAKHAARLVRDSLLTLHPGRRRRAAEWSAAPIARFEADSPALAPPDAEKGGPRQRFLHTAGFLNYVLSCPACPWRAYTLLRNGLPAGYAVLNSLNRQARVADLWVHDRTEEAWTAAAALAAQLAARDFDASQVLMSAASPFLSNILRRLGFQHYAVKPVYLFDSQHALKPDPTRWHLTWLDSDAFLLP